MVLVRVGGPTAGLLVQRLVVPQAHGVDAEQLRRGLAERGWNVSGRTSGKSSHRFMHCRNDCW